MRPVPPVLRLCFALGLAAGVVRAADDLAPPACFEAMAIGPRKVRLTWDVVATADQYQVDGVGPDGAIPPVTISAPAAKPGETTAAKIVVWEGDVAKAGDYSFWVRSNLNGVASKPTSNVHLRVPGDGETWSFIDFNTAAGLASVDNGADWTSREGHWLVKPDATDGKSKLFQTIPQADKKPIPKKLWVSLKGKPFDSGSQITAKVRITRTGAPSTTSHPETLYMGVGLNTDEKTGNGYGLILTAKNSAAFINEPDSAAGAPAAADPTIAGERDFPWDYEQVYWFKLRKDASTLRGKIWKECTPEPLDWTTTVDVKDLAAPATDATAKAPVTPPRGPGVPSLIAGFKAAASPPVAATPAGATTTTVTTTTANGTTTVTTTTIAAPSATPSAAAPTTPAGAAAPAAPKAHGAKPAGTPAPAPTPAPTAAPAPTAPTATDAGFAVIFDDVTFDATPATPTASPPVSTATPAKTSMLPGGRIMPRDAFTSPPEVSPLTRGDAIARGPTDDDLLGVDPKPPAAMRAAALMEGPAGESLLPPFASALAEPEGDSLRYPKMRLLFETAARFPLPEFGACAEVYEEDAAVIYEGMRLVANERGDYLVRFNISTPATPVVLRLKLVVFPDARDVRPVSLTLPPIEVNPNGGSPEFYEPSTYIVSVLGHSEAIRLHYAQLLAASCATKGLSKTAPIVRSGTARFGVASLSSVASTR